MTHMLFANIVSKENYLREYEGVRVRNKKIHIKIRKVVFVSLSNIMDIFAIMFCFCTDLLPSAFNFNVPPSPPRERGWNLRSSTKLQRYNIFSEIF